MTEYASFRQHIDAVLRTLNVEQVQRFLIVEGQWRGDQPADPEFVMCMWRHNVILFTQSG